MRVFYDIDEGVDRVEILRIIDKQLTDIYLSGEGVIDEEDSTLKSEG